MISKIKEIIKVLFWPILFGIGQFFICGFFMSVYMIMHPEIDFSNSKSDSILFNYISDQTLLIMFINCIIFIPLFYSVYRKYKMDKITCSIISIGKIILISFLLSSILNFVIIAIKHYMNIEISNQAITITTIVATGIIGPILEELLFRGIVYHKLLHTFSDKAAFYLSIIIFAFCHTGGIFQIIFALIIGYFLTHICRKYHNLKLSMIAHIVVNITSILLSPFFLQLF